ncbi:hypothetical protein WAB17_02740 [Parerythrobacter aurantius]|uniref:hypothetical protein n=1 Tax=Parerythrobacter aurantius TaxID=3127706 RepID=UPI003250DB46
MGVTGHRSTHPSFPADTGPLDRVLTDILKRIDEAASGIPTPAGQSCGCTTRLVTLLADGTDHHAAMLALERGWDLVTPLPFGRGLNAAINAPARTIEDARALLAGRRPSDPDTGRRAEAIDALAARARTFEMADRDEEITELLLASFAAPDDRSLLDRLQLVSAQRAALAGKVLVQQSDIVIAVWDGKAVESVGGTGHTVASAVELGVPVVWIDPVHPAQWQVYATPEELAAGIGRAGEGRPCGSEDLSDAVQTVLSLPDWEGRGRHGGIAAIDPECWQDESWWAAHAYRRIEAVFGKPGWAGITQRLRERYERPSEIGAGSGLALLVALEGIPGGDPELPRRVEAEVMRRFAWTNGIATHLADRYRSGMVRNFLMGAAAIIVGTLYLPLTGPEHKWVFAAIELALLVGIIANTSRGQKLRWHGRWFETRRAAEYLRHSPYLLALGTARARGRWPDGGGSPWPEWYVRHALGAIGLPQVRIDKAYLRSALVLLRDHHVVPQRDYHIEKSSRLSRVHHRLDHLSENSFAIAVGVVGVYLLLALVESFGWIAEPALFSVAKWFTVIAVALPTIGGAIAAIRYFGDFDRFSDISAATAGQLARVADRIDHLLSAPDRQLEFARVARIFEDADDIVFHEVQAWQAVFSGKRTTIPA